MRFAFLLAGAFCFVLQPLWAVAAQPQNAPVDEYFGKYAQSILELRNRIAKFDLKSDADIKNADAIGAMDNVEDGVIDWIHKYPQDAWALDALARLLHNYARAGACTDPHVAPVLAQLLAALPQRTADCAQAPPPQTLAGQVVDAATGAPVAGAVVIAALNHESTDLAAAAFATTGPDGSFAIGNLPPGQEYVVVEPPRGTSYEAYHGVVSVGTGEKPTGVIRLAARHP
jgi:hypothetical protein